MKATARRKSRLLSTARTLSKKQVHFYSRLFYRKRPTKMKMNQATSTTPKANRRSESSFSKRTKMLLKYKRLTQIIQWSTSSPYLRTECSWELPSKYASRFPRSLWWISGRERSSRSTNYWKLKSQSNWSQIWNTSKTSSGPYLEESLTK